MDGLQKHQQANTTQHKRLQQPIATIFLQDKLTPFENTKTKISFILFSHYNFLKNPINITN